MVKLIFKLIESNLEIFQKNTSMTEIGILKSNAATHFVIISTIPYKSLSSLVNLFNFVKLRIAKFKRLKKQEGFILIL